MSAGMMVDPIVQEAARLNAADKAKSGLRDMDADADYRAASMALKEANQIPDIKENEEEDADLKEAQQMAMITARQQQQQMMDQIKEPVLSTHAQSMLQLPPDSVNIGETPPHSTLMHTTHGTSQFLWPWFHRPTHG